MFVTTLKKFRGCGPCLNSWERLLKHLGKTEADEEPLSLLTILDSNGLDDALWCCRSLEGHDKDLRLFAVWCARQVQHLMTDERSLLALDVAERHANGLASDVELLTAWANALDAALDPMHSAARVVAHFAAWDAAMGQTRNTAWAAARNAAADAAWVTRAKPILKIRFRQMLLDGAFIGSTRSEQPDTAMHGNT